MKRGRLGLHHAEHSEKTPDLIHLCRILFMGGVSCLISTARVERADAYRARSASRRGRPGCPSHSQRSERPFKEGLGERRVVLDV